MKTIVLGDTHGRIDWKNIIDDREDDWDRVIFIGDYVDTHEDISPAQQLHNLKEIVEFKKKSDKEVVLIVGNHDYHYWPGIEERYSGYQPQMRQSFQQIFEENRSLFQIAFSDEFGRIYTHAGLTETFLVRMGIYHKGSKGIVEQLNLQFEARPRLFGFHPGDYSGFGDDIRQGCIWVRPRSLYEDGVNKLQVVGHTTVRSINKPLRDGNKKGFYLIDTLGTSGEYLFIDEGGKIQIMKL